MKSVILFLALMVVGAALLFVVLQRLGLQNVFAAFRVFPLWSIAPVIALTVIAFSINIWRWKRVLDTQETHLPFVYLWGIGLVGQAVTYLTHVTYFGGGEPVRAILLREHFDLPMRKGVSSVMIDKITELTVSILFVFAGTLALILGTGLPHLNKTLAAGFIVLGFLASVVALIFLLAFQRSRIVQPTLRMFGLEKSVGGLFLQDIEHDIVGFFHIRNPALWEALVLSFVKSGVEWARNIFIIIMLGKGVQVVGGLVVFTGIFAGSFIPLPAGLGTQEAGNAFAFGWLGFGAETGAAFSLILRIADVTLALCGLALLARWGADIVAYRVARFFFPRKNK